MRAQAFGDLKGSPLPVLFQGHLPLADGMHGIGRWARQRPPDQLNLRGPELLILV